MSLGRRVWGDIKGNRGRTVMLAAVMVVVAAALFIGRYIYTVAEQYYQICAEQAGNGIFVTSDYEEGGAFASKLKAIEGMEHVVGTNQPISCTCMPVDFKNVPYGTDGIYSAMEDTGEVRLLGNSHTEWYDTFRMGDMVLVQGTYPSEHTPGVLVANILAEANQAGIGDPITVRSNLTGQEVQFAVTGIYRTVKTPKVEMEEHFLYASASYIFCALDTYSRVDSLADVCLYAYVYADRYKNVKELCGEIEALDERLDAVDCLGSDLETDSQYAAVTVLRSVFFYILGICMVLYLGILYFMVQLWMRSQYEKIGIYLVLGKTKWEIFREIFTALVCVLLPVILLTSAVAGLALSRCGGGLIEQATRMTMTVFGNAPWEMEAVHRAADRRQILLGCGVLLLIGSLPAAVSLMKALGMHYRALLEENNKM